jgi:hypothetical protein
VRQYCWKFSILWCFAAPAATGKWAHGHLPLCSCIAGTSCLWQVWYGVSFALIDAGAHSALLAINMHDLSDADMGWWRLWGGFAHVVFDVRRACHYIHWTMLLVLPPLARDAEQHTRCYVRLYTGCNISYVGGVCRCTLDCHLLSSVNATWVLCDHRLGLV